jgi:hypothetical protein
MFVRRQVAALVISLCCLSAVTLAEGIAAHVASIDHTKQCMTVEWHNDTEKAVCWTSATKITDLNTGQAKKATDIRKGSYLRMEGAEKDGTYIAREIAIWDDAAKPGE